MMKKATMPSPGNITSALIRGLKILQRVSEAKQAVRFSDLREALPGIQDSTLTRLLQNLEAAGYLKREERNGYSAGEELAQWLGGLKVRIRNPAQIYHQAVFDLVTRSNESAGIAIMERDRLAVVSSQTAPGAVSVIEAGQTLHFEADHAGSLVVLADLDKTKRNALLRSSFSRMENEKTFQAALGSLVKKGEVCLYRSAARPGICRMAAAFRSGDIRGAIFLCLTETRAKQDFAGLREVLVEVRDALVEELSALGG